MACPTQKWKNKYERIEVRTSLGLDTMKSLGYWENRIWLQVSIVGFEVTERKTSTLVEECILNCSRRYKIKNQAITGWIRTWWHPRTIMLPDTFSSKALPSMDGRRTTHFLRFLACNADIFRESPPDEWGSRLTIQSLRSDKDRSDCWRCVGRDDIVRYARVCWDRVRFEEVIGDAGDMIGTEDSLPIVGDGWEPWDGGWGFRLNANFALGTFDALKDSTAFSKPFNCCKNGQLFDGYFLDRYCIPIQTVFGRNWVWTQ